MDFFLEQINVHGPYSVDQIKCSNNENPGKIPDSLSVLLSGCTFWIRKKRLQEYPAGN